MSCILYPFEIYSLSRQAKVTLCMYAIWAKIVNSNFHYTTYEIYLNSALDQNMSDSKKNVQYNNITALPQSLYTNN